MKINIFGVGRSGTKALQLWMAYLLIQKYGRTWINYEPFWYRTKSLVSTQRGRLIHRTTPLILESRCEVFQGFESFCRHLADHEVVMTKFIRGNGRINRINEIIQPDCSILVVRNLYEVLNSIALQPWSLVENKREWQRLVAIAQSRYPFLAKFGLLESSGTNKIVMSAVYWFVMNMTALEALSNTIVVDFNQLEQTEFLPALCGLQLKDIPSIDAPMFRGNNIHRDYPLEAISPVDSSGDGRSRLDPLRNLLFKLFQVNERKEDSLIGSRMRTLLIHNPLVASEPLGDLCQLSKQTNVSPLSSSSLSSLSSDSTPLPPVSVPKVSVKVAPNRTFDNLSARVSEKLHQAIEIQMKNYRMRAQLPAESATTEPRVNSLIEQQGIK